MIPALEVRDLHFGYARDREVLRGLSFRVEEGECVALVGPNGAGKSTLLLHLNGLLPERDMGQPAVFVHGMPVNARNRPVIHQQVGLLFQDPDDQLFCPTVFEDVAFGPQQRGMKGEELDQLVRESLRKVGMEGAEAREPHRLSGGEKRRICLAGVLACEPSVLILDEPTSNLDPRGKRELKALLQALPITRVIATHDLELVVELCSRALLVDGGRLVGGGTPAELLGNEELMLAHGLEKPHILRHRHPH